MSYRSCAETLSPPKLIGIYQIVLSIIFTIIQIDINAVANDMLLLLVERNQMVLICISVIVLTIRTCI